MFRCTTSSKQRIHKSQWTKSIEDIETFQIRFTLFALFIITICAVTWTFLRDITPSNGTEMKISSNLFQTNNEEIERIKRNFNYKTIETIQYQLQSIGYFNVYIRIDRPLRRVHYPAARYSLQRIPLDGPFFQLQPEIPIYVDQPTKQTVIFSFVREFYLMPPLVNVYGRMFSFGELLISGFANLANTTRLSNQILNMSDRFLPKSLRGSRIPKFSPGQGFKGGLRTKFGSLSIPVQNKRQIIIYSKCELEMKIIYNQSTLDSQHSCQNYTHSYVNRFSTNKSAKILRTCQHIKAQISSTSQLFYRTDIGYNETINYFSSSSIQFSTCTVEPGTKDDVAIVMRMIAKNRVPFAIKGGGHAGNPGFSSTTGILIYMKRLNEVTYDAKKQTVDLGAGLTWGAVYNVLDPLNVTVVGGRVANVGVAGLTLGGGYSWKTNRYGLTIDNVLEYELVSPNGTIVNVNSESYSDIFFGLKGGFNNFGIVTRFKMRTVPQTKIFGGILYYNVRQLRSLMRAIHQYERSNRDPNAQIIGTYTLVSNQYTFIVIFFYDEATAPVGVFDMFKNLGGLGTLTTQSYSSFVEGIPIELFANLRGRRTSVSVIRLSVNILETIHKQFLHHNLTLGSKLGTILTINIQSFAPTYLNASQGGAYPHVASSTPLIPIELDFRWALATDDEIFIDAMKSIARAILQAAINDGQDVAEAKQIIYPNYALPDTPLSQMYGDNLSRLRAIRKTWDPDDVMYLTGGYKF